jgi:hypothetical protein
MTVSVTPSAAAHRSRKLGHGNERSDFSFPYENV